MASTERSVISFRNESHMFFIYDHRRKTEEDDPKDAILYFYPASVETDDQIALVGGLIGLTDFCLEFLPGGMPHSVKLSRHNFAMLQTEDYILGLSGSRDIPDDFLLGHMQFLWSTFVFYQGSISAIKQRCVDGGFLKELHYVWDMYLPMCQSQGDILSQTFQILPYVQFQKSQGNLFLHASHILQRSIKQRGVIAGAIFNKNKVLCTQLNNFLTRKLLLLMLNSQSPGVEVNSILELPGGVRLMYVFIAQSDYQGLGHRRTTAFNTQGSSESNNKASTKQRFGKATPPVDLEASPQPKSPHRVSGISDKRGSAGGPQEIFQSHLTRVDSDLSYRSASCVSNQTQISSPLLAQNSGTGTDSEVFLDTVSDYKDRSDGESSSAPVNSEYQSSPSQSTEDTSKNTTNSSGFTPSTSCNHNASCSGDTMENHITDEEALENVEYSGFVKGISHTDYPDALTKPTSLALNISKRLPQGGVDQSQCNDGLAQRDELIKGLIQHNQEIDESLEVKENNSGDDSSTHSSSESRLMGNKYDYEQAGSLPSLAVSELTRSKDRLVFDRNDSDNSDPGVLSPTSEFSHPFMIADRSEKSGKSELGMKMAGKDEEGSVYQESNIGNSGSFDVTDTRSGNSPTAKTSLWSPHEHGLEQLTLYIQGHSDTLLVLLLDEGTVCNKEYIHSLWKSCLSHLAELDFEVKNAERFQRDENEHPGSCYHYMHYDSLTQNLTGSALFPVTNLGSEMVDACVRMHEDFVNMPGLQDCIYRSHDSACFGCNSVSGEVYFQIGAQGPSGGNVYWTGDKTYYLNSIAKGLLKKDHDISFY